MPKPVMSPLVTERICALPVGPAAVKFLCYLVYRSEYNTGVLPAQKVMSAEYGVSPAAVSLLLEPLFKLNIVLRNPSQRSRRANSYFLHPLAARYESTEALDNGFAQALEGMQSGPLPRINLPEYQAVPPAEGTHTLRSVA
ncbi:hypothetical protein ACIPY6_37055 [Streptomyces sp. NPDC090054]|uniref:hypothetical protein n=1 Tax=Streptomyces sp. NPDC090054 TaxID=3365933 RepID=UPI0038016E1E